jgi:4-diphosphocytidyl-2-C-methyl-D-erythritol kinase
MISFPHCKINLGLHVTGKRGDGFHNIETVFYPVGWCDALEMIAADGGPAGLTLETSGEAIEDGKPENNIIHKAWSLLSKTHRLPQIKAHLHKNIPMGAGLGGGSSDGARALIMINELCGLGHTDEELADMAAQLGSDCPFFIHGKPMHATGRGEVLRSIKVDLTAYHILLVYPGIHVSTADAYRLVAPAPPPLSLTEVVSGPVSGWREALVNDFEPGVFRRHPLLKELKEAMYEGGAEYAAMSGSGSTVFGLFRDEPPAELKKMRHFHQEPGANIL